MKDTESLLMTSCPIPISEYDKVLLAHGSGGRLTGNLIEKMFLSQFKNEYLQKAHDGAILPPIEGKLAFTTDSFVVNPVFFPGGNIGHLAINGTVNDLVCCGARPLYISLAFILEEGFPMNDLWKIVVSISEAAKKARVRIVTGDTKVVEKGKGDKIYINTSGIGEVISLSEISPANCRPGDVVIITGKIAEHGIAVLSKRENLSFETQIKSDTAALFSMMKQALRRYKIHVIRDPTRGGVAGSLNEICACSKFDITLYEEEIPLNDDVRGACELLGYDPLYIANEGKLLIILPEEDADCMLHILRSSEYGKESVIIGKVTDRSGGIVTMKTSIGTTRIIDMPAGEQLPRIC